MKLLIPGIMAVILSKDREQILLHLRSDNNLWSLPGGSAEFGEDIATVLAREVREETGIAVSMVRAFALYSSPERFTFRYPDGNEVHSYVVGIECVKESGVERPESDDSLEVKWFPVNNLPANIMEMQLEVILDALDSREFLLK